MESKEYSESDKKDKEKYEKILTDKKANKLLEKKKSLFEDLKNITHAENQMLSEKS